MRIDQRRRRNAQPRWRRLAHRAVAVAECLVAVPGGIAVAECPAARQVECREARPGGSECRGAPECPAHASAIAAFDAVTQAQACRVNPATAQQRFERRWRIGRFEVDRKRRWQSQGSASPEGPGGAQTSEERRQAGEKSLDDSLGDFDKTLKKEQERVAQGARLALAAAETEVKAESGEGCDGEGGAATGGGSGQPRSGDLQSSTGNQSKIGNGEWRSATAPTVTAAPRAPAAAAPVRRRFARGSDDDIVAQRLRKAAEEETDPELKERLWKNTTTTRRRRADPLEVTS